MRAKIFLFFTLILLVSNLFAADIKIMASVDRNEAAVGEQIILSLEMRGAVTNLSAPKIPDLSGFRVYSSGRSQSFSIINGKTTASMIFTYVLNPIKEGRYMVPAIKVRYKGREYASSPIKLKIHAAGSSYSSSSSSNQQASSSQGRTQAAGSKRQKDIFIKTSVNKKNVYVNEPITLSFKFYTRLNLFSSPAYEPPSTSGFWLEDLPPQRDSIETLNGLRYKVIEIKSALFGTASGDYTIGPASLKCQVQNTGRDMDDFFGGFFSSGKAVTLRSKPINIKVKALPKQGVPKSFSGSVGVYSMKVASEEKTVKVGEPINLIVSIGGTGNIKAIGEPILENLDHYKKYDAISSLDISKANYKVSGTKNFKIVLVPKVKGKLKLPKVEFSFFDIRDKKYKVLRKDGLYVNVKPGAKKSGALGDDLTVSDVKVISDDIRFIKSEGNLQYKKEILYKRNWFIPILIAVPFLYLILFIIRLYKIHVSSNKRLYRKRRALRVALRKIDYALRLLNKKDTDISAYLFVAFNDYLANTLSLTQSDITIRMIKDILDNYDIDSNVKDEIENLWEELHFLRFSSHSVDTAELKTLGIKIREKILTWDTEIRGKIVN